MGKRVRKHINAKKAREHHIANEKHALCPGPTRDTIDKLRLHNVNHEPYSACHESHVSICPSCWEKKMKMFSILMHVLSDNVRTAKDYSIFQHHEPSMMTHATAYCILFDWYKSLICTRRRPTVLTPAAAQHTF